jgi:putative ABC transport system permease protein
MQLLLSDLRYGWRMLLKDPGPTMVAALALTLAIGANSAIFSVVNGVLLQPMRYTDANHLVVLWQTNLSKGLKKFYVSAPDFRDWSERQHSFDQIAAYRPQPGVLTGHGMPEHVESAVVSPEIFRLLGANPTIGRTFFPDENQPGKNHVAILSYGLWQRRFGGDASILGKTLTLDGNDYTIVGVADPKFRLIDTHSEIWIPYTLDAKELLEMGENNAASATRSAMHTLKVVGHLKPGVSIEQARQEMQSIARGLEREYPDTNTGWGVNPVPLQDELVGNVGSTLITLLGAVGFVLLIACTNVANLLLARTSSRQKEIAIRTALGAGRFRIVRQLLSESLLLALVSGALGLLLAYWGVRALVALSPGNIPRIDEISVDGHVLLFTFLVAILTGILFGLGPAISASRAQVNEILKAAGRSSMASVRSRRVRNALVIVEVAMSVVLLIGAGLMIRSFAELQRVNPGFQSDHVLTMQLTLPEARYSGLHVAQFYKLLLDRVHNVPGVETAGITRDVPLSGSDPSLNFIIEHRPPLTTAQQPRAKFRAISADYFAAMRVPLLKGRYFSASDAEQTPAVAIINDTLARRNFPGEEPLGQRIQSGFDGSPWYTIVGVIGNVKHGGLDTEPNAEMYFPYLQVPPPLMSFVESTMTLVVRTNTEPSAMAHSVGHEVQALDPDEAVFKVATMDELLDGSVSQPRFRTFLLGIFAAVALILASTGLYGVISYSVSQRSNELGIRAALGARQSDLLGLVLGEGARLAIIGVVIGLGLSFVLAGAISNLLYGVKAHDPLTFVAIPLLLLAVALFASYVPARRATHTDPTVALRQE